MPAAAPSALTAAFLASRPTLLRLLAARLGGPDDAEDALQELWIRVERLDPAGIDQPAAFLYRMAANYATDRRLAQARRGARDAGWLEVQPGADEHVDPERALLARDALARVETAMAAMPDRMRIALTMFRLEEQPHRAIAQRLGITVSGVEKLLRRAYKELRDAAETSAGSGEP